ncbi:uncharacterized protein LOC131163336 [Malania oleifera]|uniref:uncharacterized protein LOC131163336 n=1 Tax=Malania oleifera TaxID=397392 RepID=UPI0025ADC725|nr:uncharacterized protein LOC131163336 [Malania oleifera]
MGNCIETYWTRRRVEGETEPQEQSKRENQEENTGKGSGIVRESGLVKENGFGNEGMRVKAVLTKQELEWLMFQLKGRGGEGKRLEEVLEKIKRGRAENRVGEAWKPSLESIVEIPEVPDHMDR